MKKTGWTYEELKESVDAYLEMMQLHFSNKAFIKKAVHEKLADKFDRTHKAFERRMGNISSVVHELGYDFLPGYKPLANIGSNIKKIIQEELNKNLHLLVPKYSDELEQRVDTLRQSKKLSSPPKGNKSPKRSLLKSLNIDRDAKVKAWVLKNSMGKCECCGNQAPFKKENGLYYLEIHHLKQLADNGPDVIENAIAICPNCHRELHLGINKEKLKRKIYSNVKRLKFF